MRISDWSSDVCSSDLPWQQLLPRLSFWAAVAALAARSAERWAVRLAAVLARSAAIPSAASPVAAALIRNAASTPVRVAPLAKPAALPRQHGRGSCRERVLQYV